MRDSSSFMLKHGLALSIGLLDSAYPTVISVGRTTGLSPLRVSPDHVPTYPPMGVCIRTSDGCEGLGLRPIWLEGGAHASDQAHRHQRWFASRSRGRGWRPLQVLSGLRINIGARPTRPGLRCAERPEHLPTSAIPRVGQSNLGQLSDAPLLVCRKRRRDSGSTSDL